jgi:hypothetical protein
LTPRLKQKLAFECLGGLVDKFFYFFNDVGSGMKADDVFIRKVITSFFSSIHFPNETIKQPGEGFESLFLIQKGKVLVSDLFHRFHITTLNDGSYFGDY